MWWMMKAMIRCFEYLQTLKECYMVMQVHDELVFDLPRGRGEEPWKTNLPLVKKLQQLMEKGGDDIGVRTPVAVKYHAETWSEGVSV
jgi:DNA polymerase I-like protein with 3'-5' exonuclease and polymerase domains